MDAQRALLDQLMGKTRNQTPEERSVKSLKYDSPSVCKWFNVRFCPNDLFTNTKSDFGPCPHEHDPRLKAEFEAAAKERPRLLAEYERDFLRYLKSLLVSVDKRIRQHTERLNLEPALPDDPDVERAKKDIANLDDQIKALNSQMETLGMEGKVDESQALQKLVDELKQKKADTELIIIRKQPQLVTGKTQIVCEVCSAILVKNDAEQRVQSHLQGKQHLGYDTIRKTITELEAKYTDLPPSPRRRTPTPPPRRRSPSPRRRSPRPRSPRRSRSPRKRSPRRRDRQDRPYDRDRRDRRSRRSRSRSCSRSRSAGRRR